MSTRRPLPADLLATPFTPAQAAGFGVGRARLDGPGLVRTTYGGRSAQPVLDVAAQARGVLVAVPPDVAVSHTTAVRLWGLPLATTWRGTNPVDLMRDSGRARLRRRGVVFHRGLELREARIHLGVRVVSPAESWADLADLLSLDELVVAGDGLIHHRTGLATVEDLLALVQARAGWPGTPLLRLVLPLLRDRSGSPMESLARLLFHHGGLPEPELNVDILNARGEWLANGDFVWRGARLVGEYDGDVHRERERWRQTVARRENLQDEGWRVISMTAPDIERRPHETVNRFRRALGGG